MKYKKYTLIIGVKIFDENKDEIGSYGNDFNALKYYTRVNICIGIHVRYTMFRSSCVCTLNASLHFNWKIDNIILSDAQ